MRLLFGDCLDLLPGVETGSVGMVMTDLPYATTRNGWDTLIDPDRLWPELWRVLRPGGAVVMTTQMPFTAMVWAQQPKTFRHHWVWEKGNASGHLNAKRAPMKAHEELLVFAQSQPTYNPQKTTGHARKVSTAEHKRDSAATTNYGQHGLTTYDSTERYPRTVIRFPLDKQKSAIHPTQKPVALFEYMIRTYSNPDDLVLDVAAGSGTTAIAAAKAGRRWLCMERDEMNYAAALCRIYVEADR